MSYFDHVLVAPTPEQVLAALSAATDAANDRLGILPHGREHWERVAAEIAGQRKGRRVWSDSHRGDVGRVVLSWWTDHVGRRHFRVVASNSRDRIHPHTATVRRDSRPLAWHVYPDRLFYREKGGSTEWWVACGCGAAGRPEHLAWMGPRCGICHDRLEEGLPVDEVVLTGRFVHQPDAVSPLFSPDGTKLAVVLPPASGVFVVRVRDLETGGEFDLPTINDGPQALAFSPDGKQLAYTDGTERLLVLDLTTDTLTIDTEIGVVFRLAFSPAGDRLAIANPGGLRVWSRVNQAGWRGEPNDRTTGDVTALAFAAPTVVAMGGRETLCLYDLESGKRSVSLDTVVPSGQVVMELAFLDERRLVCISEPEPPTDDPLTLQVLDLSGQLGPVIHTELLHAVRRLQLSPCGRHLAVVAWEAKAVAILDVLTGAQLGVVGWDTETPLERAVLSPDSRTVALVDATGTVKLVPWAALLA